MRRARLILVVPLVAALLALHPAARATPTWAPAATATIHPGVQVRSSSGQCTANFVFTEGTSVFIGQAAHCTSLDGNTVTNGCGAHSLPLGSPITISGASRAGVLVYNSWLAMHETNEKDANACAYNDLALVRLDPADVGKVNPTVPHWGGPSGIGTSAGGDDVYSYGNSGLRGGITMLSPKQGIERATHGGGWSHVVYTVTPGIPGDSGSAFLNATGQALGVLSTLGGDGSNGVGDLAQELRYLRSHSAYTGLQLALGTEQFDGDQLPLG